VSAFPCISIGYIFIDGTIWKMRCFGGCHEKIFFKIREFANTLLSNVWANVMENHSSTNPTGI